MKINSALGVTN